MRQYLKHDEWRIIEEGFNPDYQRASESIFSLGNGKMGQRANFEETYSGSTLQGSYIAGVYYPDKTRVGWWKNGYPEYFAKVLNSPNYIGINVEIEGEQLDLFKCKTEGFVRTLDMQKGILSREFKATLNNGKQVKVDATRFLSMSEPECAFIRYAVTPLNFTGQLAFEPYIDGDVENEDSNYDEKFWNILTTNSKNGEGELLVQTKKLDFRVAYAMNWDINTRNHKVSSSHNAARTSNRVEVKASENETIIFDKFIGVTSSLNHQNEQLISKAQQRALQAKTVGFDKMLKIQINHWATIWEHSDIKIEGDVAAQQGIRFNIFQLNQTYTGDDERLNVGPKGFTGEKYGGTTYWDTEAYCIPFFLATAPQHVTRNLLVYRYKHLQKAIENAEKLGFTGGAALYPMVTINGEECHNEWEITFEEIHRNGAIAFAIYNYIRHTGDEKYLEEYGLEVLIAIARFWAQRANWSGEKQKYVILGVTGPNEYENNINNNWYTNKMAVWCMTYAAKALKIVETMNPSRYQAILENINFKYAEETAKWAEICEQMHFPFNKNLNIFMQQDGFMDKEQMMADDLPASTRPINQHWSWDRILRSCFIKQADTLQGIYVFEDEFDTDTIRRHFDFYEPRTVHESSLSPCVHVVLAARLGKQDKAYDLYLRTSRLDLDDYNNEVHEGLHITSMAGTWMSIVEGFGGKRVKDGKLHLNPIIPQQWKSYAFMVVFRGNYLEVKVSQDNIEIISHAKNEATLMVYNEKVTVKPSESVTLSLKPTYYA
ncbi:family 65 glycosyl hydrolase domain-containing protein [Alkalitalea saponilacus]|uniref:Maltose phosphorylase n=1 Tax=Alkalitalea saponilacus TaxID=889453 RepID=A0A1T5BFH5_9BACT|nr:family 65 glycosyl hydrolase domain-containing protein [Alkalitalea saponilacus]ASB49701.1 family 65 glycosyl hydrolase [Alkalitalea saponilacus]SKB45988.1 maltose phosphorylase [Alkalitalea saponilacus]